MNAQVYGGTFSNFNYFILYLLLNLLHHLLDSGRMYAAVGYELVKRQPGNLAPNWVEGGKDDGFGGIVNNNFNARGCFESSDVSALTANDTPFNLIGVNVEHGNRIFNCCFGCNTLNGLNHYPF